MRPPDLDLDAAEALRARRHCMIDEFLRRVVQPPAFGVVDGNARLCAAGRDMQRRSGALAAKVPKRDVDGRQRQAHCRADRVGMGVEEEALPDILDHRRVPPEQPWRHVIAQERHDGGAAGSDRVAVTGAVSSVVREDAHDRRLLLGKSLNGVAAHHLWCQIDLADLHARDFRHRNIPPISLVNSNGFGQALLRQGRARVAPPS